MKALFSDLCSVCAHTQAKRGRQGAKERGKEGEIETHGEERRTGEWERVTGRKGGNKERRKQGRREGEWERALPSSSSKDTSPIQLGSFLMTSFNPNYLLIGPAFKYSHTRG